MKTTLSGCVLVLLFAVACNQKKKEEPKDITILPGSINASLTLPNGASKTIDSSQSKILSTLSNFKIHTPRGCEYSFMLADSTKVDINTASTVHVLIDTQKSKKTITIDEGESYFEYTDQGNNEVHVNVRGWVIKSNNAKFNVKSYDSNEVSISCLAGNLSISNNTGKEVKIHMDQQLMVKDNIYKISIVDTEHAIAWKRGFFYGPQLKSILDQISRWYDIDVIYDDKLPVIELEGDIYRTMHIEDVIELLQAAAGVNVKLDKENRKLYIN